MEISSTLLIIIITSSVTAFLLLVILLYFLILRNKKLAHTSKELMERYKTFHQLLVTIDRDNVNRLEEIAQVNLLYGDIHKKFLHRYVTLLEEKDKAAENKVKNLESLIANKHFKSARNEISSVKGLVNDFVNCVKQLDQDLKDINKPEEECEKQKASALESFRNAVAIYQNQQEELIILKDSYTIVISKIEKMFKEVDEYIDEANYEEANSLLPRLNKVIAELYKVNEVMPNLCMLATKAIPQKIGDLKIAYKRMLNEACPVVHLINDKTIPYLEDSLAKIVKNLKSFVYKHKEEELNYIATKIDNLMSAFEKEKVARSEFDAKYESIRSEISYVEKDFIKLCNSLPRIKQYYLIADEKMQEVTTIQNLINKLGVAKRSFDNLIHNGSKTPFSVLLEKSNELKIECDEIKKALINFRNYLLSLKDDVEYAHQLTSEYFYKLKKAEKIIRDAALPIFHEKYDKKIDEIYQALDTISIASTSLPIDVNKIFVAVNFVKFDGDSILNQIDQDQEMMSLAEGALTYTNRGRHQYEEINMMHKEAEKLFEMGEFEKSYLLSKDRIIKRLMILNMEKK